MSKYRILAHYWNDNGTNDIEILDLDTNEVVAVLKEALHGVILDEEMAIISLQLCLKQIAAFPANNGTRVLKFLSPYFPELTKKAA